MAFFEDGDRLNFYRLFDRCIPEQYRLTDLDAQKVEFWLQIYFAVFPALPAAGGKKGALLEQGAKKLPRGQEEGVDLSPGMARLRAFIETRGADAARTEEFLPYYALPFVPRPQKHPAFSKLFEPKWTIDMRGMLERFVANAPSETPPPRVHSILLHYYGLDAEGAAPSPPRKVSDAGARRVSDTGADDTFSRRPPGVKNAPRSRPGSRGGEPPGRLSAFRRAAPTPMTSAGFGGPLPTAASHGPRGITPLLEGRIELSAFYPEPDYSDLGAEVLTLDSLKAQVRRLEPPTPESDSPPEKRAGAGGDEGGARRDEDEIEKTLDEEESRKEKGSVSTKRARRPRAPRPRASAGGAGALPRDSGDETSGSETGSVKRPLEAKYLEAQARDAGRAPPAYAENLTLVRLDYREVILEFRSGVERLLMTDATGPEEEEAESRVSRLTQALRWRVSRAPEGSVLKVEAVRTMVRGDALALRSRRESERGSGSLVDAMLLGCRGRVRAETLRLVNALAAAGDGRRYLLSPGSRVVAALASTVDANEQDTRARRHLLGAMQKLSFHAVAARRMCALGVMGWVTRTLLGVVTTGEVTAERTRRSREGLEHLSEYDAEHGAALLMNLSLVPQGRRLAARAAAAARRREHDDVVHPEEDILEVTRMLLQSPSENVRVYANGALYSLLRAEDFRAAAIAAGFESLLEELREHSDPTFYRQLSHLLGALRAPSARAADDAARAAPDDDPGTPFEGYGARSAEPFEDVAALDSAAGAGVDEEDDDLLPAGASGTFAEFAEFASGAFAPVGVAGAGGRGGDERALVGEPLLREEYAAEEGVDTDSGDEPPLAPDASPFAGGAPFSPARLRGATIPEDPEAEDSPAASPGGSPSPVSGVVPTRLYRDPDAAGAEAEEAYASPGAEEDAEVDAARFAGEADADEDDGEPGEADPRDDVLVDAARFARDPPRVYESSVANAAADADADETLEETLEETFDRSDEADETDVARGFVGEETLERSGGFGAETAGPDELAVSTQDGAARTDASASASALSSAETEAFVRGDGFESDAPQVVESSADIDDEAPAASSADVDDEVPRVVESSAEIDDDAPRVVESSAEPISSSSVDEAPRVVESSAEPISSSSIEDAIVAAASSELTDAIDEEDEDAFDETFDDGADLPVSAANEPEPLDPLLGPDAEAAGEDKDA